MKITKYNVKVNGKKIGYVDTLEKCAKVLKKYPTAQIVTVVGLTKEDKVSYVIGPYLD